MNDTAALDAYPDDLTPVAPRVGPFPHAPFIRAVHGRLAPKTAELVVSTTDSGAVALTTTDGVLRFAAEEYVTDYHSPLGAAGGEALEKAIASSNASRFEFDSLPSEARDVVADCLGVLGVEYEEEVHAATGVLTLPDTFDDWLASIGKKERHEVRRKRRKLVAEHGEYEVAVAGQEGVDAFCDLHRTAPGDKGSFMTEERQAYFTDLIDNAGAVIHNLRTEGGVLASAFGFETEDGYFFYNSAFDAEARAASPGVVLLSALIEAQIERGAAVFDFLKGAESYKYRHGAVARDLYRLTGNLT